jgi:hypothetical protein
LWHKIDLIASSLERFWLADRFRLVCLRSALGARNRWVFGLLVIFHHQAVFEEFAHMLGMSFRFPAVLVFFAHDKSPVTKSCDLIIYHKLLLRFNIRKKKKGVGQIG